MNNDKVVLVTNIPSPYRIPLFNEISQQLKGVNKTLVVIFGNKTYSRRKFDAIPESEFTFDHIYLNSGTVHFGNQEKTYFSYNKLFDTLNSINPLCVIINGFTVATTRLWLESFKKKRPFIIWTGTTSNKSKPDSLLRKIQRKLLIQRASAFICYGSRTARYLAEMGASKQKLFIGINTVDTSFFKTKTESARKSSTIEPGIHHITYIGYLSKRKNVQLVLDVVKKLLEIRNDFVLDIIGDGPDKEDLETYVDSNKLEANVEFHGFKQKNELPHFLALSECLLFHTNFDIWGLVVNEAMAASVPVIVSPNAGCGDDLIRDGENGFIVDFNQTQKVVQLINSLLDDTSKKERIGQKASEYIEDIASIKKSASGFVNAINLVLTS
jgi:glycosyltransferase involved in cell wall biosynthesis